MKVHFYSFQDGKKDVSYITEYEVISPNTYRFLDKSVENTYITLTIKSNSCVLIKREGSVNSLMEFNQNKSTSSLYKTSDLTFKFDILTKEIKINSNSISIDYDYFYESSLVSHIKIALLFKDLILIN